MPKNALGRSIGQDHCCGTAKTFASGHRRANGPTKILCSYCAHPRTMYSTGRPSSLSSASHSSVGATGLCTQRPPLSRRMTVIRTFTEMLARDCSCSKVQMPSPTWVLTVRLSKSGPRGNGKPVKLKYVWLRLVPLVARAERCRRPLCRARLAAAPTPSAVATPRSGAAAFLPPAAAAAEAGRPRGVGASAVGTAPLGLLS
mmetsp:Transcript_73887/g.228272  ORF Transcript_73887/g.228272 Transcript_73887/m.228272 type:complete len:201 (-) Transcript_73887:142-744(-)